MSSVTSIRTVSGDEKHYNADVGSTPAAEKLADKMGKAIGGISVVTIGSRVYNWNNIEYIEVGE